MSVTEEIFARLSSVGTNSILTASAVLSAMLPLPSGPYPLATAITPPKPYYKAIEASDSSIRACHITARGDTEKRAYLPKTALGKRLMALRNQAIAKGLPLLNASEIVEEIRRRRGERV